MVSNKSRVDSGSCTQKDTGFWKPCLWSKKTFSEVLGVWKKFLLLSRGCPTRRADAIRRSLHGAHRRNGSAYYSKRFSKLPEPLSGFSFYEHSKPITACYELRTGKTCVFHSRRWRDKTRNLQRNEEKKMDYNKHKLNNVRTPTSLQHSYFQLSYSASLFINCSSPSSFSRYFELCSTSVLLWDQYAQAQM